MAATAGRFSGDARRNFSPRGPGRENQAMSNRPCNNGPNCRKFQEGTCPYNHDIRFTNPNLPPAPVFNGAAGAKRSLNVDSPAFTPLSPNVPAVNKSLGISPKAAAAAVFTPKGSGANTPAAHSKDPSMEWPQQGFQEFVPQNFAPNNVQAEPSPALAPPVVNPYDPFIQQQTVTGLDGAHQQAINPYAQTQGAATGQFYQDTSTGFKHPLNYHLYASLGPYRENLLSYQRTAHDFFIADDLREDLQRKSEATLQTFANTTLPQSLEYFHSLVALDTTNNKGQSIFGYPSWIYKAVSNRDGNTYALRRLEGFRLTDERAIRSIQAWKRVNSGSVVSIHDAFTTRQFGDSSLIVVSDYHPLSQPLSDKHFATNTRHNGRGAAGAFISEQDLWGYLVQIANAVKCIHSNGLAARIIGSPSKILLTSKNRVRLNACGVVDIVRWDQSPSLPELQQADLLDLGRLILCIGTKNPNAHLNGPKSLEHIGRAYSQKLRETIQWLLSPPTSGTSSPSGQSPSSLQKTDYNIDTFLVTISTQVLQTFDSTLHNTDTLVSNLSRELENARLVRLMTKLNLILERPESTPPSVSSNQANLPSNAWSETGERYYLKLFRDYVFHQVDHEGRPVLDLGHVLMCLNKLDAGIDEKVMLVSRDEQNCFVLSYREVKRACEAAWTELVKASTPGRR